MFVEDTFGKNAVDDGDDEGEDFGPEPDMEDLGSKYTKSTKPESVKSKSKKALSGKKRGRKDNRNFEIEYEDVYEDKAYN